MKKSKLRTFCFSLLLIASIGSYTYINSVQIPDCGVKCEAKQELLDNEEGSSSSELPDVKLLKKLIEKGKELMPSAAI